MPPTNERTRKRPALLKFNEDKRVELARWVSKALDEDLNARSEWNEMRLQRVAKMRGWLEAKNFPWENSSNARVSSIMEDTLRTQDNLHNAVLMSRPVCNAQAIHPANQPKQKNIDTLIDWQIFVEQKGEIAIGQLVEQFVNDSVFVAYLPWIREEHDIVDMYEFDPPRDDQSIAEAVAEAFNSKLKEGGGAQPLDDVGWTWRVAYADVPLGEPSLYEIDAYWDGENEPLVVRITARHRTFDGTVIFPKFIDEWVAPVRAGNLQPPTLSNPKGADHVFLMDYVPLDEVKRLKDKGFYDLITDDMMEEIESMATTGMTPSVPNDEHATQKDLLQGVETPQESDNQVKSLRRVIAFARHDTNDDDLVEDVVLWVVMSDDYTQPILVKSELLTELYPAIPPRRPFATATFLPVEDRLLGISLPELVEGIYDLLKTTLDQTIDNGTLKNLPWFTYRATSGMRPETIRLSPGEGYPTADPKNDISIPNFPNAGEGFGFNLMTVANQMRERLSMIGDTQFGRVPFGSSSALRTSGNMQALLQQADARPERILRRLFTGLTEIWTQFHEMNRRFLPKGKQVKITGPLKENQDPYITVDPDQIEGRMRFEFKANVLNTNKSTAQDGLMQLSQLALSDLFIQLGITTPDTAFQLIYDVAKVLGQEPAKYFKPPTPQSVQPRIQAQEAIMLLTQGEMPVGVPLEDPEKHFATVLQYAQSKEAQTLPKELTGLFQAYLQQVKTLVQQKQQEQRVLQGAQQLQQQLGGGGQPGAPAQNGGPPPPSPGTNQPLSGGNELFDEALTGGRQ